MSDDNQLDLGIEGRNVGMYPEHWVTVDEFALEEGLVTRRGGEITPNTSAAMRRIVETFAAVRAQEKMLAESPTLLSTLQALVDGRPLPVPSNVDAGGGYDEFE
jgi:hypothetical protein